MIGVDLILTASSRAQARGYLAQLRQRQRDELLTGVTHVLVSPDPGARRAGSGTATLLAIAAIVRRARRAQPIGSISVDDALAGRRVLIIHCGGDSRRLPAYAAQGKIFIPLPCEERPPLASTLFDLILEDLMSIEWPPRGGVLVASGDVLLGVASHSLRFDERSVQCVASPGDLQRAARHGVFITDPRGEVIDMLQKPDEAVLRAAAPSAIDGRNRALVDLGLVFLPPHDAAQWLRQAERSGVLQAPVAPLDLYAQMLPATAHSRRIDAGSDPRAAAFLASTCGSGMRVHTLGHTLFFHIGSTRELLERMTDAATLRAIGCTASPAHRWPQACVLGSVIAEGADIRGRAFVESSWLPARSTLHGENIVVGVPRECDRPVDLPSRTGLACLPINEQEWSAIAFGIDDDFKTPAASGGTFAGQSLALLDASSWQSGDDCTLWSARLWQNGSARDAVAHAVTRLRDPARRTASPQLLSAAQVMSRVNHRRLFEHRLQIVREAAFAAVAQRVRSDAAQPALPRTAPEVIEAGRVEPGRIIRASAPVRIDLAGGWSDTPPICHDVGGAVVNVAVRLNDAQPIRAEARLIEQRLIRIRSIDLKESVELRRAADIAAHCDPGDWAALPKAALTLSGLAPADGDDRELAARLNSLGGGVELTIASDLPKGSGLGTSSILGATTLACLARLVGEAPSREMLIQRTSALEQMISTAGGWQDQAGGITPGCKLLTTAPGPHQVPDEQTLPISADFWLERVLLYSTGLQRLARDILQNVVWRWLGRGPQTRRIVQRLREGAQRMREDLLSGDCDGFARGVLEYWELKKAIDPGATTPLIEDLLARVSPHLSAWELPGAGGGGFLFMIARDAAAAQRVREMLNAAPPNTQARFFDAAIDDAGLTVSVFDA